MNAVCVIWNSFQIADTAGCELLSLGSGVDRCRC